MNTLAFVTRRIQDSDLDDEEKRKALRNLIHATPDETDILCGVFEIRDTWRFAGEILRGAHVRIFDMGARYDDWKKLPSADTRRSSHHSDGPQYHVNGPLVHTVLFGKIGNRTWLQLEGNPQGFGHVIDWIKYSVTHENQGPYGSSRHVENRPIEIMPTQPRVVQTRPSWVDKVSRQPRGGSPFR
jgi:hypothetical protein